MKGHIRERSPGHWAIILDVNKTVSADANGIRSKERNVTLKPNALDSSQR
jgi:hypothetical protein